MSAATPEEVLIMEDIEQDAEVLKEELSRRDVPAEICYSADEVVERATNVDTAIIAVDIDMGEGRRYEGLDAIRRLKQLRAEYGRSFHIAALTSHSAYKEMAVRAGVDSFIVKRNATKDALELVLYGCQRTIERQVTMAQQPQTELALLEYEDLHRQLSSVRDLEDGMSRISIPMATVQNALNWPFLLAQEQLILSALDVLLRSWLEAGNALPDDVEIALEGVQLLRHDRGREADLDDWLRRAEGTVFEWLDDDDDD